MSFAEHRQKLLECMEDNSIAVCYAGEDLHANEDDYYDLIVNSQFFWLTGLERAGMVLVLSKLEGKAEVKLFIDEADPTIIRWTGRMPSREDVQAIAGLKEDEVAYTSGFASMMNRIMCRNRVEKVYFDVWKYRGEDLTTYNGEMARRFAANYPGVQLLDLHNLVSSLREVKDAEEIETIRKAAEITKHGLEYVMSHLEPGKYEYQVEADFEYACRYAGMKKLAFHTIAGSGINGCMMHYMENSRQMEDGDLILLDLGAGYGNYCSDVTRTYPVNGKYTPRQRQFYDLVLKANQAIAAAARPGITTKDLQKVARKVLGEGLVELGMIENPDQVDKYYMHGCSHSIGVDVHDISVGADVPLKAGWVISDEPGLYIDEECIGIRIEDDLLITEDGAEVLTKDIIRDAEEIEKFMAEHRGNLLP